MSEQSTQNEQAKHADEAEQAKHGGQAGGRNYRKVRDGLVVSDKMAKTVVVAVEDRVKHSLYGKVMRQTKRMKVHDEAAECGVGDRVRIMETRPISKTKRWRVVEVLEKAK